MEDGKYLLIGSSFGGTIMIDALSSQLVTPHTSILVGANTHFHLPFPANILESIFFESHLDKNLYSGANSHQSLNTAANLILEQGKYCEYCLTKSSPSFLLLAYA